MDIQTQEIKEKILTSKDPYLFFMHKITGLPCYVENKSENIQTHAREMCVLAWFNRMQLSFCINGNKEDLNTIKEKFAPRLNTLVKLMDPIYNSTAIVPVKYLEIPKNYR